MRPIPRRTAFGFVARALAIFIPAFAVVPRIASAQRSRLKFEIRKDARGEFRWQLKAANGEPIATSEGYKAKASCRNAIDVIKRGAATAAVVDSTSA